MEIKHTSGRFFAKTEHGEAELLYSKIGSKTMSVYHTFTPEKDRGRGIAERLTITAFEYAKKEGLKIRPDCPYLPYFLSKHKEWQRYAVG